MYAYLTLRKFILPPPARSEFPDSQFVISPLGFLAETLLATMEQWEALPGLTPLFLREALADLLEVAE